MITDALQKEIFSLEEDDKRTQEMMEAEHKERIDALKKENDSLRKKLQSRLLNK